MRHEIRAVTLVAAFVICGSGEPAESPDAPQDKTATASTRDVMFHVGGQDLFDKTLSFRREGTKDGERRVVVDLEGGETFCPIEMGRWIAGGRGACGLEFRFRNEYDAGDYWLHVTWQGRTNRGDQFAVFCNDERIGESSKAVSTSSRGMTHDKFRLKINTGENHILLKLVSSFTHALRLKDIALCRYDSMERLPLPACPTAPIFAFSEYEQAIGEPGLMIDGTNVRLFAPGDKAKQAKILFSVLATAYDRLHETADAHADHKVVVLALPHSSPHCTGSAAPGTCVIPYGYELLDVDENETWQKTLGGVFGEMRHLLRGDRAKSVNVVELLESIEKHRESSGYTVRVGLPDRSRFALPPERNDANKRTYTEDVLFHVGGDGLFDKTLSFDIIGREEGERRVVVDLSGRQIHCPIEIGRRTTQWTRVSTVPGAAKGPSTLEFIFPNRFEPGDYWLHVVWQTPSQHEAQFALFSNESGIGQSRKSAGHAPYEWNEEKFRVGGNRGDNRIRLKLLTPQSVVRLKDVALCRYDSLAPLPRPVCPTVVLRSLAEYEEAIREPGLMLDSRCVRLFAPRKMETQARLAFPYIKKGYETFYDMIGMHTNYKLVVYASPQWSPHCWGGTATGATLIPYSYGLLDLDNQEEWKRHRVPRLVGLFEEMGHDFTLGLGTRFGGEAIGMYLSGKVAMQVTGNPYTRDRRQRGRKTLQETMRRYIEGGYVFPEDIPGNVSDRIHAEILYQCEAKYGADFWRNFFTEIRKERDRLRNADGNMRYQITVDCFDRLPGLQFRQMLRDLRISDKTSWYSLKPSRPDWDRRFIPPEERKPGDYPGD